MLKRQNVSKKLNNVTMYDTEGYAQAVSDGIAAAGQSVPCPDFECPRDCPTVLKPAVVVFGWIAAGIYYLSNQ